MPKLTKRLVDATRAPRSGDRHVWDSRTPGFGLRVFQSGRKAFVVQYRNRDGRTRKLTLGPYGQLTVDEARTLAKDRLSEVRHGADPSEERRRRMRAPTVEDLAERFMVEHVERKLKPSNVQTVRLSLRNHVLPALGKLKVESVTRQDVAELHDRMHLTPAAANRALATIGKLFSWARQRSLRTGDNPARSIDRYRLPKREPLVSPAALARLGAVLEAAVRDGSETWQAVAAIRLLLLTGLRKTEALSLRWDYIDFDRGFLLLPAHKTDEGGPKSVPLGAPALALLSSLPRYAGSPYVFPPLRGAGHFIGLHRPWARIRERAGLNDLRLHDLRHAFASVGATGGESLLVVGRILGHAAESMTARYSRLSDDPVKAAAERISAAIAAQLANKKGEIVTLPRKAGRT